MTVQQERPPDHARVLVKVGPWVDDWRPATAHVKDGIVRWRFDYAGWLDAHPNDQWAPAEPER